MKLYYASGACSLASLIAAEEAGLKLDLVQVNIRVTPHTSEDGRELQTINPKGYVPALQLDTGAILTEGVAILQYLDEQCSTAKSLTARPAIERYQTQEWLTFIATELHKTFSPWLFHPEYGEQAAAVARARIADRFDFVDRHLKSSEYLLGSEFTVADAYCFTIARWAPMKGFDLSVWPALAAYVQRIGLRPKVIEAVRRHG